MAVPEVPPEPETDPWLRTAPHGVPVHDASVEGTVPPATSSATASPSRPLRALVSAAVLVVAVALGVGLGHLVWTTSRQGTSFPFPRVEFPGRGGVQFPGFGQFPSVPGVPSSGQGNAGPKDAASIERSVDPALVDINSTFDYQNMQGAGTGIVLTSSGEVITNNHVIDGATHISVYDVGNAKTYGATVVGYDKSGDIAVLQLQDASGLRTASIGDSSKVTVGEAVLALGNAGGSGGEPIAAGGSISALGQSIIASDSLDGANEHLSGLIGTDADVQPGDSGGPLVNGSGEVIGVDTAGSSSSGFGFSSPSQGSQSYAIPINTAIAIAQQVVSGTGSDLVHIGPTAFLGVFLSSASGAGVQVQGVVSGGAVAKAGLVAGDVITSIGGDTVNSPSAVSNVLVPLHPGETVKVAGTTAKGRGFSVEVRLASGPPA